MEKKKRNLFKVEQHRISVQHSGCEKLGLDRKEKEESERDLKFKIRFQHPMITGKKEKKQK